MKNLIKFVLVVLLLALVFPTHTMAAVPTEGQEIIYLDNGYYIEVEITEIQTRALNTKSGSKSYVCRDSFGNEEWRAVLTGTFAYTGTTSYCTSYNCSVTITDTSWYTISKSASKDGASAIGNVTMGRKALGIKVDEETVNLRLTCDKNGNLS